MSVQSVYFLHNFEDLTTGVKETRYIRDFKSNTTLPAAAKAIKHFFYLSTPKISVVMLWTMNRKLDLEFHSKENITSCQQKIKNWLCPAQSTITESTVNVCFSWHTGCLQSQQYKTVDPSYGIGSITAGQHQRDIHLVLQTCVFKQPHVWQLLEKQSKFKLSFDFLLKFKNINSVSLITGKYKLEGKITHIWSEIHKTAFMFIHLNM